MRAPHRTGQVHDREIRPVDPGRPRRGVRHSTCGSGSSAPPLGAPTPGGRAARPGVPVPRDEGSASVLVLALGLALAVLAASITLLGAVAVARHRATAGADLAALAAAGRSLEGAEAACGVAGELAGAQDARVVSCALSGDVAEVVVEVRPGGWLGRFGAARARARAGPADPVPR